MTLTTFGLLALVVPIALVGILFVIYRVSELTRVSKTTRWVIAGAALVVSIALGIRDVANGGSVWTHLVTAVIWLLLIFMIRHEVLEPTG